MRRTGMPGWCGPTLGVILLAVGAGAFVVGMSLRADSEPVIGAAIRPVNLGAEDAQDIRAHNSPTVARNPRRPDNLVVTSRVDTPSFSCAVHVSADGGSTWAATDVPFPSGEELPPRCFAPDAAFGPDGTLYVSFVTLAGAGNVPNGVWVSASTDGGRTLSRPNRASGPFAFQVRIVVDQRAPARLYLSWLQASEPGVLSLPATGNPIVVSRSDDGGTTWQPPVTASSSSRRRVVAPSAALGAQGQLYVLYLDVREDSLDYQGGHAGRGGDPYPGSWSLVLSRSGDQGQTWQEAVVAERLVPTERFIVFFPPFPSLAVDGDSGRVYAAFHDARADDADVWLWASADGGASFDEPTRVNDTAPDDRTSQYLPQLAIAPGGRLDIVYYDRRSDPEDVMNEVSLQSSSDGGRNFDSRLRLSDRSFDSRIGFGSERGLPDLGSRLGLVSDDDRAVAVWTDTRAGTQASNKQDLARAVVLFSEASPLRTPLQLGGGALAAVGAAALVCWAMSARRLG